MVNTKVDFKRNLALDNPHHSCQRHLWVMAMSLQELYDINMLGSFSFKRHDKPTPFWKPHPAHRRMPRRACSTAVGLAKSREWTK